MAKISLSAIEALLKKSGAERISEEAKIKLRDYLEEKTIEIGKKANSFSKHANRKTIKAKDIELAIKE